LAGASVHFEYHPILLFILWLLEIKGNFASPVRH
jgi:hypothetical protein